MEFPLVGPAYNNRSLPTNAQQLVNMMLKAGGPGGRDTLIRTPGLELFTTVSGNAVSAMFNYNGVLHIIAGGDLFSVSESRVITNIGSLLGTGAPSHAEYVSIAGVPEVGIVRGNVGYILSGSTLTKITDAEFPATVKDIASINNVLIVADAGNKISGADVGNGLSWSGDWFDRATSIGDTVAVLEDHDEVFVFGETGIQVYDYVAQGSAFPFNKRLGAKIEVGVLNKESIAQLDNSFVFVGKTKNGSGRVWRIQGYQPINLTSPAMEQEMATYGRIDDAIGFTYYQGGQEFYVLTFPTAKETWVYDASVGSPELAWHKRESYEQGRWRANCHAYVGDTHYIGDYSNGNIYKMKYNIYEDNGQPLIAKRTFPHYPEGFYSYLKLGIESGVGKALGQGIDPKVMLRISDDDGRTYNANSKRRTFGARGKFDTLVEWHSLGMTRRQRTFEITCSDPVPFNIYKADLGFTPYGK